jgi:uncharacterized membrane protein
MPLSRKSQKKRKTSQQMSSHQENKPSKSSQGSVQVQQTTARLYQGAIPPPEMMEHFARIEPSFPDRLLAMAEKESEHRRQLEKRGLTWGIRLDIIGTITGFLSVGVISTLAYLFLLKGSAREGMWIAISIIVSLAGVFVLKRSPKGKIPQPK